MMNSNTAVSRILTTVEKGKLVEESAKDYFLRIPGSRLLAQNYRTKLGEIDLVFEVSVKVGGGVGGETIELVFVEVRGRSKNSWQTGLESVNFVKLRRLRNTIALYLSKFKGHRHPRSIRLDVMSWDGEAWNHVKNIWDV